MKRLALYLCLLVCFSACSNTGNQPTPSNTGDPHEHHDHGHHHTAPHGGGLTALGEEVAHLEIVLDGESGEIHLYLLDGSAESGVPTEARTQFSLELSDPVKSTLVLNPVADPLTGETEEKTSHFKGQLDDMKGKSALCGTIAEVAVKGQTFSKVPVCYPEGIPED